jgi:hypothetical protein
MGQVLYSVFVEDAAITKSINMVQSYKIDSRFLKDTALIRVKGVAQNVVAGQFLLFCNYVLSL